ncbi:Ogr/Delta-like zinc finger protein [Alteromonadaceae bacterium 2753L.S.0a.02]|nr:Ogr/Delta-like zinc finger protein [Alteromonadaceae bacterium 2753L.S.0a.02]
MADTSNESPRASQMRLTCPHCGGHARVRHSRELSKLFRDGIIECQNITQCGWRGRFGFELIATLTPSANPNPEVQLEQSAYVLPDSPHALPQKLRTHTLSPQQLAERDQLDFFKVRA